MTVCPVKKSMWYIMRYINYTISVNYKQMHAKIIWVCNDIKIHLTCKHDDSVGERTGDSLGRQRAWEMNNWTLSPKCKIEAMLVCLGCPNKIPQTGWLDHRTFIFSQFQGLNVHPWARCQQIQFPVGTTHSHFLIMSFHGLSSSLFSFSYGMAPVSSD